MADTTPSEDAVSEAKDAVESFIDEIVEALVDDGEAKRYISNYDEDYFENLNQYYSLLEAAVILDDLSEFEVTDSGLWEGQDDPQEAVKIQAIFTYRNAVENYFDGEMETVNDEAGPVAQELMDARKRLEEQVEALEALPEQTDANEARLKDLEHELEQFDKSREIRLKRLVLEAIGRKLKARGPKDWRP